MGPPKKAKAKASASGSAKKKGKTKISKETQPMAVDGEQAGPSTPAVWRPGLDEVAEDEELQYDPSTYDWHAPHEPGLAMPQVLLNTVSAPVLPVIFCC